MGCFIFSCFRWYAHVFFDAFAYLVCFCCYAAMLLCSWFFWSCLVFDGMLYAHGFFDAFAYLVRFCCYAHGPFYSFLFLMVCSWAHGLMGFLMLLHTWFAFVAMFMGFSIFLVFDGMLMGFLMLLHTWLAFAAMFMVLFNFSSFWWYARGFFDVFGSAFVIVVICSDFLQMISTAELNRWIQQIIWTISTVDVNKWLE